MFIIKFNNMVKNKVVWFAFAIVVAVAFGASDIWNDAHRDGGTVGEYGSLGGKSVDALRFQIVSRMLRLRAGSGGESGVTARDVWREYAALETAAELGISVSDADLAAVIRSDRSFFGQNGAFDARVYNMTLRAMDLTPVMYQEILRNELKLGVLRSLVAVGPFVPASLAADRAKGLSDAYTLLPATITNVHSAATAQVSEEEAKAFYDNHSENYRQDEMRRVEYVAFKASDYLGETQVTEEEIADYYDANESRFAVTDTNGVETVKALEDVRAEIEKTLSEEASCDLAYAKAGEFADIFYNASEKELASISFAAEAVKAGYTVVTTSFYTADSFPVNYKSAPEFIDATFALSLDSPRDRISDAIGGGAESYVANLLTNIEERVIPYEEAAVRVMNDAKANQAEIDFQADVTKARDSIVRGMENGGNFAELAAEAGLAVGTNTVFTFFDAYGKNPAMPSPMLVARAMSQLGAGDVSEPISVPGGVMFFTVVDRRPGEDFAAARSLDSCTRSLQSDLAECTWNDWLDANLDAMDPAPLEPFGSEETDEEEDFGEEE